MIYEYGEPWWNEIDGKSEEQRKICPSATLSTINFTWNDPGTNPGLRSERLASNCLSYDMASAEGCFQYVPTVFILCHK
jgi:hypothetical protein